jgi:hypothetical protein
MAYVLVRVSTTTYPPSAKLRELLRLATRLNAEAIAAGDASRWIVIDERELVRTLGRWGH